MNAPKLVLHPRAPRVAPAAPGELLGALSELGLIGARFELDGRSHFRTGPRFLDHISFLGCSPAIELDPPPKDAAAAARAGRFCHLHLHAAADHPVLRVRAGHSPRCRHCRGEIGAEVIESLTPGSAELICPACGRGSPIDRLNWRQAGAFARIFLDIWGIHDAEAVPGDPLLDCLAGFTASDWGFFYTED